MVIKVDYRGEVKMLKCEPSPEAIIDAGKCKRRSKKSIWQCVSFRLGPLAGLVGPRLILGLGYTIALLMLLGSDISV
jgi:hypothetical protein